MIYIFFLLFFFQVFKFCLSYSLTLLAPLRIKVGAETFGFRKWDKGDPPQHVTGSLRSLLAPFLLARGSLILSAILDVVGEKQKK